MGFWNKLGKIALQAAPYVAAPFTGGASLMATGATQKLGQKWAESDAKKAIAKGLEPSKFDKILGMASAGAGIGSMAFGGALSGLGKAGTVGAGVGKGAQLSSIAAKAGTGASKVGGFAGNLGKIANAAAGKGGSGWTGALGKVAGNAVAGKVVPGSAPADDGSWSGTLGKILSEQSWNPRAGGDAGQELNNRPDNSVAMPQYPVPNQAMPRPSGLGNAISRGKDLALLNQPYRQGYNTVIEGPEEGQTITTRMPQIYPNYGPPPSDNGEAPASAFNPPPTPIQNRFNDELTPRRRVPRQQPVQEEEY